jgi:hypothetical protein
MKRDAELIRELLLKLETLPVRPGGVVHLSPDDEELAVEGYEPAQIEYHLDQIHEAGLIDDGGFRPMRGVGFRKLTWAGHDFVDTVRDPEVWAKTKEGASVVKSWSLDTLKEIGKGLIKKQIEEYTGVKIS